VRPQTGVIGQRFVVGVKAFDEVEVGFHLPHNVPQGQPFGELPQAASATPAPDRLDEPILACARGAPAARFLKVYAGDFTVLLPLEEALRGGALLARRLNGQPLTQEHGAPLRLVAPGRACFYSVKWVDRLELLAEEVATTGASIARNRLQS
jgi:hypothetical protein